LSFEQKFEESAAAKHAGETGKQVEIAEVKV